MLSGPAVARVTPPAEAASAPFIAKLSYHKVRRFLSTCLSSAPSCHLRVADQCARTNGRLNEAFIASVGVDIAPPGRERELCPDGFVF